MSIVIRSRFGSSFGLEHVCFCLNNHLQQFSSTETDCSMGGKRRKTTDERYQRLISLGKSSFVSQSGIAKLLSEVKKNDLPEAFNRKSQYRAREYVCQTQTPYGKLVEHSVSMLPHSIDLYLPHRAMSICSMLIL